MAIEKQQIETLKFVYKRKAAPSTSDMTNTHIQVCIYVYSSMYICVTYSSMYICVTTRRLGKTK